ncbi:MAG: NifU family protein [Anaerovoracaceae bacterium]|jgi:Fe-S cluster biogenesis protein NfuA
MEDQIKRVLEEKVNPILASHHGGANLVSYEDGVVLVRLTGACSACPSAQYTIEDVVKSIVMEELKEVKDVVLDTSISSDLIDMAKKILNKDKQKN